MERLTSNKPADSMPMIELAHNSCYVDENNTARYRDYNLDIDCRELARNLINDMCDEDLSYMSDESFDEYMAEMLSVEIDSQIGLLAVFYRNLWAMADLREKLKEYEDLEEQGRLIKIPLEAYCIVDFEVRKGFVLEGTYYMSRKPLLVVRYDDNTLKSHSGYLGISVFLTKSEAEAKLKELRGVENESSN